MATADGILDDWVLAFDGDRTTQGLAWLNERYRRMVVEAQWFEKEASLGTTTAGTSDYAVTAGIEDIASLYVGDTRYWPVSWDAMESLEDTESPGEADGPVFSPYYNSTGVLYVRLHPEPEASGLAITAHSSGQPTALTDTANAAGTPSVPDDLHPFLRDGLWADSYSLLAQRPDMAQYHDSQFLAGIRLLQRRKNSRFGSGPSRLQVSVSGRG